MREIKFRAWNSILKKMVKVTRIRFWDETVIFFKDKTIGGQVKESALGINNCLLMQYTGLKDKEGVEIYEGDIVELHDTGWEGSIIFKTDIPFGEEVNFTGWWFKCKEEKDGFFPLHSNSRYYRKNILKVIGNIYENEELLK